MTTPVTFTVSTGNLVLAIIGMFIASGGFWAFITNLVNEKSKSKKAERKALLGLLHEKLVERGAHYIDQGYITHQDYNDFKKYIYDPYKGLSGNGTGDKVMSEIDDLPFQ